MRAAAAADAGAEGRRAAAGTGGCGQAKVKGRRRRRPHRPSDRWAYVREQHLSNVMAWAVTATDSIVEAGR